MGKLKQNYPPPRLFVLLFLHFFVSANFYGQEVALDSREIQGHYDYAQSLFQNKYTPDSLELSAAESSIIRSISEGPQEQAEVRRNQLIVLHALVHGYDSWLYPDLLEESMDKYPDHTGINQFFLGTVNFTNHSFEKAVFTYHEAIKRLNYESEFYLSAHFNLAAAYSESGRNANAIDIFDSICSPETRLNNHPHLYAETIECIRINLAAMHIDEKNLDEANRALGMVDTSLLDNYWHKFFKFNEFSLRNFELKFEVRDSIFDNHIAKWSINELPVNLHRVILQSVLESENLPYFLNLQRELVAKGTSPLLEKDSGFKTLLSTSPDEPVFSSIWNAYCSTSKELRSQRVLAEKDLKSRNALALQRINEALNESQIQQDAYKKLFRILLIVIPLSLFLFFAYKKYNAVQNSKALEASLRPPVNPTPDAFQLTREDLRIVGDAITVGKRISDAMLILKKLSASLAHKEQNLVKRDLSSVPEFHQLNAREQNIAQLIDAGFDSKEIARIQNVTSEYVYNVRSRVRKKLNIPPDVELGDWFRQWP